MTIWTQTLNGKPFDLLDPTPDMVDFEVIAKVLARTPRFGGHTLGGVLSVAQHCVVGADAIMQETGRKDWAGAFLLHDAHEAYIGDIGTPVVQALAAATSVDYPNYSNYIVPDAISELKLGIDSAIYTAAGLSWPLDSETHDVVKVYDTRMLITERNARCAPLSGGVEWPNAEPIKDADCSYWPEELAASMYRALLLTINIG